MSQGELTCKLSKGHLLTAVRAAPGFLITDLNLGDVDRGMAEGRRLIIPPDIERVIQTYLAAWNENDPQTRRLLLEQCATEDIIIINEYGQLDGRHEAWQSIEQFRQDRPADRAVLTSRIETVQNWFRFTAAVIRPDGTSYSQILDIGELGRDGKIVRIVTFRGSLPPVLNR